MSRARIFMAVSSRDDCLTTATSLCGLIETYLPRIKVHLYTAKHEGGEWKPSTHQELKLATVVLPLFGKNWEVSIENQETQFGMREELIEAGRLEKYVCPVLVERTAPTYPADLSWLSAFQHFPIKNQLDPKSQPLLDLLEELSKHTKPVAFVSSTLAYNEHHTLEGLDYFTNLITGVAEQLELRHVDVALKVPRYSPGGGVKEVTDHQLELVRSVLANKKDYRGLIIAPYEVEPIREALVASASAIHRFPIATIDKAVADVDDRLKENGVRRFISVEADGLYNGTVAAQCAAECMQQLEIPNPVAAILMGRSGSEQRAAGFETEFKSLCPGAKSYRWAETDFTQRAGRDRTRQKLENSAQFDILFACNDELALGARAALMKWDREHGFKSPSGKTYPLVIGFDGISDVTRLLIDHDRWLLNTIKVKLDLQVRKLVTAFVERLEGNWQAELEWRERGERFHNDDQQRSHVSEVARIAARASS